MNIKLNTNQFLLACIFLPKKIAVNAKDDNICEILILHKIFHAKMSRLVEKSHKPSLLQEASRQLVFPNQKG